MSIADLKAWTQHIFDVFNTHDPVAAAAHFTHDAELRDIAAARPIPESPPVTSALRPFSRPVPL